jgi:hypothetical protein
MGVDEDGDHQHNCWDERKKDRTDGGEIISQQARPDQSDGPASVDGDIAGRPADTLAPLSEGVVE